VAIVAFIMLCPSAGLTEDSPLPNNLLGFLKPGMCVGVQSYEGAAHYSIEIYTQVQYQIAHSLPLSERRRLVKAQEIVDKYPAFKKTLNTFVETLREQTPDVDVERVFVYPQSSRKWFGTISAVGNDYVLIDREGEAKSRRVLAKSAIVRIDLDAEPTTLRYFPPRVSGDSGRGSFYKVDEN
jgi:hypothetical protein